MKTTTSLFAFLLFLGFSSLALAQTGVKGNITDAEGKPLYNASVLVEGQGKGAVSNEKGYYEITGLKAGTYKLIYKFMGFNPQTDEVTIVANQMITNDFQFAGKVQETDDIVVIGYGTQRTKDLTGSAAVITEKNFVQGSLATPEQLVMGKVAGLKVTSNDGAPGSGSTLRLRGGTSINASNDPLIVVDGVPLDNGGIAGAANPLSLINPNDIASFVVLKDASATAIYGSRAANGVILITTKRGSAANDVKVVLDSKTSVSTIAKYFDVLSADSLRNLVNSIGTAQQKALLGDASTDWQREVFRKSVITDNNVSITGGITNLPYRLSIGNRIDNGILKRDQFQRTSVSLNLNPSLLDKTLQIEANMKYVQTGSFFANRGALGAAFFDPTQPVYSGSEAYGGYFEWIDNNKPNTLSARNPLGLIEQSTDKSRVNRAIANAKVTYNLPSLPALKATVNVGGDYSEGTGYTITPATSAAGYYTQGRYTEYRTSKSNKLFESYLSYNSGQRWENQTLDVTAGYSYQDWDTESPNNPAWNEAQDSIIQPAAAFPFYTRNVLMSYYGRAIYNRAGKYVVNVSVRRDGSSRFSPETRWGIFPAASAAWIISEEAFMKKSSVINMLKLRAGWGVTGQQDGIGDYAYIGNYFQGATTAQYAFGGQYYQVLRPAGFDAGLKWETTTSYNLGLDFGFKNDRFSGSVDVYQKDTKDLLATVPVPAGTNFTNEILTNVGAMQNRGIEVALNTGLIATKDMRLDWTINATYNKNEVKKLSQVVDTTSPGVLIGGIGGGIGNTIQAHQIGYPTYTFFVLEQQYDSQGRVIEVGSQAEIDMNGDGNITAADKWKDTNAFVDQNGDGIINVKDRYYAGQAAPKMFFGTAFNFQYKKWYAGLSARAELGATIYNNIHSNSATFQTVDGTKKYLNNISSLYYQDEVQRTTASQLMSNHYLESANFLRLDFVNIGYNFGKLGFSKDKVGLNINFVVQNALVLTKYSGQDPEIGSGIDNNFYPRPRVYSINLTFDF
ncbi:MAG: SusC/RagA family TonB-linked outer membrane protein [Flavobacteriales bacterium]